VPDVVARSDLPCRPLLLNASGMAVLNRWLCVNANRVCISQHAYNEFLCSRHASVATRKLMPCKHGAIINSKLKGRPTILSYYMDCMLQNVSVRNE
jgi:hypothetical protein